MESWFLLVKNILLTSAYKTKCTFHASKKKRNISKKDQQFKQRKPQRDNNKRKQSSWILTARDWKRQQWCFLIEMWHFVCGSRVWRTVSTNCWRIVKSCWSTTRRKWRNLNMKRLVSAWEHCHCSDQIKSNQIKSNQSLLFIIMQSKKIQNSLTCQL